jgi:uncharacterized membrane protein YhaH (DUF805 family)
VQKLSPIGWALRPLRNYANFSGRASRAEFWWFFLFVMILYLVMWIALMTTIGVSASSERPPSLATIGAFGIAGIFMVLFWLVMLIPALAVQVRRLHDTDRSGWWLGAYYLLYVAYMVVVFGSFASLTVPSDGSPPSMGGMAALSIIGLVFFVYAIVLLVFFCLPGTNGANRFGDDPYGANVEEVFA